jgi:hypothetical protein
VQSFHGKKLLADFDVGPNGQVYGEISLDRAGTVVSLFSKGEFDWNRLRTPGAVLRGVLHDGTKVTVFGCALQQHRFPRSEDGSCGRTRMLADFVAFGSEHLAPDQPLIRDVHFGVDDATSLYYDFDAFGSVLKPEEHIETIANANFETTGRRVPTGPDAAILYFAGRRKIFGVDTALGRVSATHNPGLYLPDPGGLRLPNQISTDISFDDGSTFDEAISRVLVLLGFMEMLIGRPQNITDFELVTRNDGAKQRVFQVYWNWAPARASSGERVHAHPAEVLASPIEMGEEFCIILKTWLQTNDVKNRLAREAFRRSFAEQVHFSPIRLLGAATMFDVLPDTAFSKMQDLPQDFTDAQAASRALFEKLPKTNVRNDAVQAISRLGRRNLREKIQDRAKRITEALPGRFPNIDLVIAEAVKLRNFLVHGDTKRPYDDDIRPLAFMIETLEFVFGASELIACGWDANRWALTGTSFAHPFGCYRANYSLNFRHFKEWLDERSARLGAGSDHAGLPT